MQLSIAFLAAWSLCAQGKSEWVYFGPDRLLHYKTGERGDRIMDFSAAGYQGGGVRLPWPPLKGDNTAQIQAALDSVNSGVNGGANGVVLLAPGEYEVAGTLTIARSGVVLRGSGAGDGGTALITTIKLTGAPHRFLDIRGSGTWRVEGDAAAITDAYVPSGADSFGVDHAAGFHAGDRVLIQRPVTEAWVHFMGMDTLVRDGKQQTWIDFPGTAVAPGYLEQLRERLGEQALTNIGY